MPSLYKPAAVAALAIHLAWIMWVIFGALWTRGRPLLTSIHMASLFWGIVVETGPWACPLTLFEQFLQSRAGLTPYQGGFLLHYLDRIVYPDLPWWVVTTCGVAVCVLNLGIYARRAIAAFSRSRRR